MKKLVLVSIMFMGCNENLYLKDVKVLEEKCKDRGGWVEINTAFTISARCHDGTFVLVK